MIFTLNRLPTLPGKRRELFQPQPWRQHPGSRTTPCTRLQVWSPPVKRKTYLMLHSLFLISKHWFLERPQLAMVCNCVTMPWTRQRYKELIKRGLLRLIYPWIMIEWLPCRVSSHCLLFHFTHRLLIHVDAGSSLHEDSLHQSPESSRAGQTLPPWAVEDSLPGASSGKDFWNQSWQQGHGWWWWWGALLAKPGPASFPLLSRAQLLPPPAWELTNRSLPAQLSCYSLHLLLWGLNILWSCNI